MSYDSPVTPDDTPERLYQRIQQLEQKLAEQDAHVQTLQASIRTTREEVYSLLLLTPSPIAIFRGTEHVYDMVNSHYLDMVNHRDVLGKTVREAWPEAEGQGFFEMFDYIYASGESYHINEAPARIDRNRTGEMEDVWFHLVYQPFRNTHGEVEGILHMALDITPQIQVQGELETRNREIEHLNQALQNQVDELRRYSSLMQRILDNSPSAIFVKDCEGRYLFANAYAASFTGLPPTEVVGKTDEEIYPPEIYRAWSESEQHVLTTGETIEREETTHIGGQSYTFLSIKFPIFNDEQEIISLGGISTNITERKHEEEDRAALQLQVIEAQNAAIRELSTPLMPLAEGVLAMPLVGAIDSSRAQQVMEALLEGVAYHRAEVAILDITGVQVVDTQVADSLLRAAQAVKLLGAQVVLTGINPAMAQTLVHLGADMSGIVTRSTLQSGIAWAVQTRGENRDRQVARK